VPINTLLKNLQKIPSNSAQSERIENLEQYIRTLGHDPDKIAQRTPVASPVVNEHGEVKDLPAPTATNTSQDVERQKNVWLRTTKTNSRNSEQARLVQHDEETTYIETFVNSKCLFFLLQLT